MGDRENVTISEATYIYLLRANREYEALRQALYLGGISAETLDLLISNMNTTSQYNTSLPSTVTHTERRGPMNPGLIRSLRQLSCEVKPSEAAPKVDSAVPLVSVHKRKLCGVYRHDISAKQQLDQDSNRRSRQDSSRESEKLWLNEVSSSAGKATESTIQESTKVEASETKDVRRTLYFRGFAPNTTYRELLSLIKGGKVLTASLRGEGYALVTFVEDPTRFLSWAQTKGLVLKGRSIKVKWAHCQYPSATHIARQVTRGATRNLVIHDAAKRGLTAAVIRSDMEHIHNMVIIDVAFTADGNAQVSTNSIHVALYARTCMMSRTPYRHCKVEFFPDECDTPIPKQVTLPLHERTASQPQPHASHNRFDILGRNMQFSTDDDTRHLPDSESDMSMSETFVGIRRDLSQFDDI